MGAFTSRRSTLIVLLAGLALTGACGDAPPAAGPIVLVDDLGDTTALTQPAERVVSLAPTLTEALFAIGAGGQVVGRTRWDTEPAAAESVPSVGDGLAPNVEAVLARAPDLVAAYAGGANAQAVAHFRAAGVPVLQFRVDGVRDWARAAERLGRATGHDSVASALAGRVLAEFEAAARAQRNPLRVAVVVGVQPPIVIGSASFLGELVTAAGGRNAFDDLAQASAPVSMETLAARDPDLVITLGASVPEAFSRPEWQAVRAVREGRTVALDGTRWSWPSARTPAAIEALAGILASVGP